MYKRLFLGSFGASVFIFVLFIATSNRSATIHVTDIHGRPLEAGTIPHYFSRDGMCAMETVLAMIAEGMY